jgi:hypothetical protein
MLEVSTRTISNAPYTSGSAATRENSLRCGRDLPSPGRINMMTSKKSWTAHAELLNVSRETLDHVAKNHVSVADH